MLQALGYSGPIHIETTLASILRVPWLYSGLGGFMSSTPGSELDDDVAFSIASTSEAMRKGPDGIVMDILRYVLFSVNWPDLIEIPQTLENLVYRGYAYNSWPRPDKLGV